MCFTLLWRTEKGERDHNSLCVMRFEMEIRLINGGRFLGLNSSLWKQSKFSIGEVYWRSFSIIFRGALEFTRNKFSFDKWLRFNFYFFLKPSL